jgi:hypothetical protein
MSYLNGFLGELDVTVSEEMVDGIIGEIGSLDYAHPQRRRAVRRMTRRMNSRSVVPTRNLTGKAEFENRMGMLPLEIQQALRKGDLQLCDYLIYTAKKIGTASNAELMVNSDVAVAGLANINNRKLEANRYFLLTGIQILSGASADPKTAEYALPEPNILNGEFELNVGDKTIIPRMSMSAFDTGSRTDVPEGFYKLDNPKMIPPLTEIKPEIWTPAPNAENTCVKIVLWGVYTQKN